MAWFEKALEAGVMSTHLLIRANVSRSVLMRAYDIAVAFENRYSAYREDSFLSRLNRTAHLGPVECTAEDIDLFRRARLAGERTGGRFDFTIGSVSHGAYHFGFADEQLPDENELSTLSRLVDFRSVDITESSIFFRREGIRLDLGGIGKGYCAKRIASFLLQHGATKLLVDVGGEIVTVGRRYRIAVKHPLKEGSLALIRTGKSPTSVSTSGNYERFIGTPEHHHILDTRSAKPPKRYRSMTVIRNGFDIDLLDAYATALFNEDPEGIKRFCTREEIAVLLVDTFGDITINNLESCRLSGLQLL